MGGSPSAFTSRLNGLMLSVTPENVLQTRDTLASELIRLQNDLDGNRQNASCVAVLGPDPVSRSASAAFNSQLPGLVAQFEAVVDELKKTVEALTDAARGYELAEEGVAGTMRGIGQ